jgi:hypothetical protein
LFALKSYCNQLIAEQSHFEPTFWSNAFAAPWVPFGLLVLSLAAPSKAMSPSG